MPLSHENVGSKIVAKIKIYILTRAELLLNLCYEIPCKLVGYEKCPPKSFEIQNACTLIPSILHPNRTRYRSSNRMVQLHISTVTKDARHVLLVFKSTECSGESVSSVIYKRCDQSTRLTYHNHFWVKQVHMYSKVCSTFYNLTTDLGFYVVESMFNHLPEPFMLKVFWFWNFVTHFRLLFHLLVGTPFQICNRNTVSNM